MPEFAISFGLELIDGVNGYKIAGKQGAANFGFWVAGAGDINGDGLPDLAIGAPDFDTAGSDSRGAAYVLFGGGQRLAALDVADGAGDGEISVAHLDGYNGFELLGAVDFGELGGSVNAAGDVNGDGFGDLLVGAASALGGRAFLVMGKASGFAASLQPPVSGAGDAGYLFTAAGPNGDDELGSSVASAGDFNGDGFADLLLGAREADPISGGTDNDEGAAYLIYGGGANLTDLDDDDGLTTGVISLSNVSQGQGSALSNSGQSGREGFDVASVGDINGDGFGDVAVGIPFFDPLGSSSNEGGVHVLLGRADPSTLGAVRNIFSETGVYGFQIAGIGGGDQMGRAVAGGGDINGDGFDDILVAAPYADPNNESSSGSVYVLFGKQLFRRVEDVSQLDGTNGFRIDGVRGSDFAGISVNILGDVNGDGFDDVGMGAHFFDRLGYGRTGAYFVVFGKKDGFEPVVDLAALDGNDGFRIEGDRTFGQLGRYTGSALGDINGDGFDDILIGDQGVGASDYGAAYIVFGHKAQSSVVRIGTELSQTQNGGIGDDEIFGNDGNDILVGHEGFDYLDGGAGNDILNGGAGADEMRGGSGRNGASYEDAGGAVFADLINSGDNSGEAAGDTYAWVQDLHGSAFNDTLLGDGRVNFLFGNGGNDTLNGRAGDDFLEGGAGADALVGGGGVNTAAYSLAGGPVVADLVLPFRNQGDALGDSYSQIQNMAGSVFADELWGSFGVNRIDGGDGDDILRGRNGNDILNGGMGDDTLEGGANADQLNGGGGVDTAAYQLSSIGVTADLIVTASNTGDAAGDTYSQIQNLTGSIKADTLRGTFSANVLNGSGGNDVLQGRGGGDTYTGGADSDRFVFQNGFGLETITDFNEFNPLETIDLSMVTEIVSFADLQANHMFQAGAHVEIIDGLGGVITVLNAQVSDMDAGDFNF